MSADDMDDLVKDFLVESNENLEQMDQHLLALERDPTQSDRIAGIFRGIHSIKGICGFLGYSKLEGVAHAGENLLSKLRDGKMVLNSELGTLLLSLSDAVRAMLSSIEQTGADGDEPWTSLVADLEAASEGRPFGPGASDASGPPPEPAQEAWEPEAPTESVEVPPYVPPVVQAAPPQEVYQAPTPIIPQYVAPTPVAPPPAASKPEPIPSRPAPPENAASNNEDKGHAVAGDTTVRVDVGLLDGLMDLVGELVLARNRILQSNHQGDASFQNGVQRLNVITTQLQEGIMKSRMQSIGTSWNKLPRVVRDVAKACDKRARVEMEGAETELDRTIAETIKDPLTHILRNSIDHGLEKPEIRRQLGKDEEGTILLRAFHEGGQVVIQVVDDGAGVNIEAVRNRAISRNLITPEQAAKMTDPEIVRLLFLPGFSTAEKVSNISGRGVGMDVVKTNIERIGGSVHLESRWGQGTTLTLKIPLTLAIIPAIIVTCGGQRFAIPQVNLVELVGVGSTDGPKIENIHGVPVFRLRDQLLPLVMLRKTLELPSRDENARSFIVVLSADKFTFGVVVDSVQDTQEIVVKPLSKLFKDLQVYAGTTILGDGTVSLILDVTGVAKRSGLDSAESQAALALGNSHAAKDVAPSDPILLFAIQGGSRMAIPVDAVARLEEFPIDTVESSGLRDVVQYRGDILPLLWLSDILPERRLVARDPEPPTRLSVVVHHFGGQAVGLVVDRIIDIVDEPVTQERPGSRDGVKAVVVIQGKVTEMLDVEAVVRSAAPDLLAAYHRYGGSAS